MTATPLLGQKVQITPPAPYEQTVYAGKIGSVVRVFSKTAWVRFDSGGRLAFEHTWLTVLPVEAQNIFGPSHYAAPSV